MILITSAAYVNSEFQTEFGRLPPSFLPVGNRRLFEHQIDSLREHFPDEALALSLPDSYHLAEKDARYLMRHGVHTIRSDEGLDLASAVAIALDHLSPLTGVLRILHGDTLVTDLPHTLDVIGIVRTTEDYAWEVEQADNAAESVWCGYFSFADPALLLGLLQSQEQGFTASVRRYSERRALARVEVAGWFDFGHVNTYFHSRARLTTERAFNSLRISDGCVHKTGTPHHKIQAEARWFHSLPASLRVFTPQLIDFDNANANYTLEYLPIPPLNEVFVHGRNPTFYWDNIFLRCAEFMQRCHAQPLDDAARADAVRDFEALAGAKTWDRLEAFRNNSQGIDLDKSNEINGVALPVLAEIVKDCLRLLDVTRPLPGLIHGDFCLSNILFDSRSGRIKVIDPRGLDSMHRLTSYGDLRYDIAKLAHSVVGLYDHIVAGAFELEVNLTPEANRFRLNIHTDRRTLDVQNVFLDLELLPRVTARALMPMVVLLFISMLPLHADRPQRQTAFLANALRLYSNLDS
jgi:hypothetical protein